MRVARAASLPLETGGFLLGMRRGPYLEITGATFQGPQDVATTHSFERRDGAHAKEVETAWSAEEHLITMVGDWHSHPSGDASPSGTDRQAWRKLSETARADFVGIILGPHEMPRVFLIGSQRPIAVVIECPPLAEEEDDFVFGPTSERANKGR